VSTEPIAPCARSDAQHRCDCAFCTIREDAEVLAKAAPRSAIVPTLIEFSVRFELPARVTELQPDAALEQAEKLVRSELQGLVDICPALAGFRLVVERVDEP